MLSKLCAEFFNLLEFVHVVSNTAQLFSVTKAEFILWQQNAACSFRRAFFKPSSDRTRGKGCGFES